MADKLKAVPEGFHTLTPHLTVRDARQAIDFYQRAFGAEVIGVHYGPEGKIMHATLKIGDSMLMLNDEFREWGALGPPSTGGSGVIIHMYLENVDAAFLRVVSAGATVKMLLADAFWGDRYGAVVDPFGHTWSLASKVKDVSKDELDKAAQDMFGRGTKKSA
jgi:PhnB protein